MQIKCKTVRSWTTRKKKEGMKFLDRLFCRKGILKHQSVYSVLCIRIHMMIQWLDLMIAQCSVKRRLFIWYCLLILFRPSKVWSMLHHGKMRASSERNKRNLTLTLTFNLVLPSNDFHNKICVFMMIFTAYLRLVFYMRK